MRKREIIKRELIRELDRGEKFALGRIRSMLPGILIFRPLTYALLVHLGRKDKRRTILQIDSLLDAAELLNKGVNPEEKFLEYLSNDVVYLRSNERNPKFGRVKELLKEIFLSRASLIAEVLSGSGSTYDELVRSVGREKIERFLEKEYEVHDELIMLYKKDRSLIKVPGILRGSAMRIIEESYIYAKKRISSRLDEIYGKQPTLKDYSS
jgi:hypothetical protein